MFLHNRNTICFVVPSQQGKGVNVYRQPTTPANSSLEPSYRVGSPLPTTTDRQKTKPDCRFFVGTRYRQVKPLLEPFCAICRLSVLF
jgi:hypothetical protein